MQRDSSMHVLHAREQWIASLLKLGSYIQIEKILGGYMKSEHE